MKINKESIVYKKINELHLNERNPRKNDEAVATVAKSIEKYGFRNPLIIDSNGKIYCGNTRFKAAKKLGLTECPCIVADDLTEQQIREYALIDNKSNEIAEWDFDLLSEELADLDLDDFGLDWGIDQDEIDAEEKASEDEGKAAVDTLPDSRVLAFSLSAFGTASECFLEIIIPQEESEKLIKYIRENGSEKILEQIRGVIESV